MDDITWMLAKVGIVLFMKYWLAVFPWQVNGWLESHRWAGTISWGRLLAALALLVPHSLLFLVWLGMFGCLAWQLKWGCVLCLIPAVALYFMLRMPYRTLFDKLLESARPHDDRLACEAA